MPQPERLPASLRPTPTPIGGTPMYQIPEEDRNQDYGITQAVEGLPELKPEDHQYFGKLLQVSSRLTKCSCISIESSLCIHSLTRKRKASLAQGSMKMMFQFNVHAIDHGCQPLFYNGSFRNAHG